MVASIFASTFEVSMMQNPSDVKAPYLEALVISTTPHGARGGALCIRPIACQRVTFARG
jgi:hypothetical protein